MSQPFKLFRLQQVDSQIDQAVKRLKEISILLSDHRELKKAEKIAADAEEVRDEAYKDMRRAEENTQSQRSKIKVTEHKLYSGQVKNPKELQDLQNESEALKRYLEVLEEEQLEKMLEFDDADNTHKSALTNLEEVKAKAHILTGRLETEKTGLEDDVGRWNSERGAMVETIEEDDLEHYENLRSKRRGVAVSKVINKTCGACGGTLSTALLQSARSPSQLTHCDTCGRILLT